MHPAGVYIGRVESHMKKYENDKMIIFIVFHIFHNFDFFRPAKNPKTFFLGSVFRNSWLASGGGQGDPGQPLYWGVSRVPQDKITSPDPFLPGAPGPLWTTKRGRTQGPSSRSETIDASRPGISQNRSQEECFFGFSGRKKIKGMKNMEK